MTPALAARLARPASRADRARAALVVVSTAVAGAFLLAGLHLVRDHDPDGYGLARYVTEGGLRPGVATGAHEATRRAAPRTGAAAKERRSRARVTMGDGV